MQASLLVEVLTEELPPKSLRLLSESFGNRLLNELIRRQLKSRDPRGMQIFATPRRLAVLIPEVDAIGEDWENEVTGPSTKAPQQAIEGFAKKQGVAVNDLVRRPTAKGEVVIAKLRIKGLVLKDILTGIVEEALKSLPIPKVMRWGTGNAEFVRPVHGVVMLHGERVVPGTVLGIGSGNRTLGHRFMAKGSITISSADQYEQALRDGHVIADFGARRAEIERQLKAHAAAQKAELGSYIDLLDEVTALVEYPSVYVGGFDEAFLEVPQECLILTMRQNQKYFPLFEAGGKLLPRFLIVSNMKVADPRHIIDGNEKVVRPRLEDARFFYNQDRKTRLDARVPQLAKVVYHNKLGSQLDRVKWIQGLAAYIAEKLGADVPAAERAALLAKADLQTGMVGEFPELQGVMGRYYAIHDGEQTDVANAIEGHYRPRFAGDRLPEDALSSCLALSDKLVSLVGLFGIGEEPTGERDPFGLRRAALGVIRILVEKSFPLHIDTAVSKAFELKSSLKPVHKDVLEFIYERFAGYLKDLGFSTVQIDAVLVKQPSDLHLVPQRLEAVRAFEALPEADSLAAANKRIANILKQADGTPEKFDRSLLTLPEEKALATAFELLQPQVEGAFRSRDYTAGLKALAALKAPVDAFFDKVMVMDKDPRVRANRIGFLGTLHGTMNRIADLSKLAK